MLTFLSALLKIVLEKFQKSELAARLSSSETNHGKRKAIQLSVPLIADENEGATWYRG